MTKNKAETIINLKNVKKAYVMGQVEVPALRGINLEIKKGEFLAIVGPSGSGKSTLLNMVGCLDVPTTGVIELEGVNIKELSESDLAQIRGKKIGFVFQFFNLIPTLTALENVTLPLIFQEVSKEEREERARTILKQVGLEKRMHHRPGELSGGEQQRVAIARALIVEPDVILADEPTGNLDLKTGEGIMAMLEKIHEEKKKTIITVTHERFIAQYAHRIVQIRDGMVVSDRSREHTDLRTIKEK